MRANNRQRTRGFSLLEILIAFSILAVSLGILLNIFSGGINSAITAEDYTVAVQIAESLLAKSGTEIKLKDTQKSGVEDDKYHWSLDIQPYRLNKEIIDQEAIPVELYQVSATVEWGDAEAGDESREVQFITLKLAAKNPLNGTP